MQNHTELIQYLIYKYQLKSYLEIGVESGNNFNAINCEHKIGIDPAWDSPAIHWTSDEFFERNTDEFLINFPGWHHEEQTYREKFDIIFIDGWHHAEQSYKDILNAIAAIHSDTGFIICHDCNPTDEEMQVIPRQQKIWTGDVWKAWVKLRQLPFLEMFVLDMDYGCGVIRYGMQEPLIVVENPSWSDFMKNRKEWLNLKDADYIYTIHN